MGDKLSENIRGEQVGVSKTHHREHRVIQRGGMSKLVFTTDLYR